MSTVLAPDLTRLQRQFQALQLRFAGLQGQATELRTQHTKLAKSIALIKARVDLAPQVTEAFNFMQEKAHARAVGDFEELLSAFVSDVVPEAGSIRLELGTERGAPALDILIDSDGEAEDILDGNGGGLTNVIVTGLVYAALARTNNRPLVVLDEPDCWIKAGPRVPAFTKVIAETANPQLDADGRQVGGCQTLMISHNDISLMAPGAHVHELFLDDGVSTVRTTSGARAWDDETQVGIRWIEVENLRKHANTRMELSPGLNVLTGDINLGKSTLIVTPLRVMAYGEADDLMIRHHAAGFKIRVGLENNVVLEAERSRKGSPKMVFRRYEGTKLTNQASPASRGEVPDFITRDLRIERVDGLNIQLRSQKKDQLFLLDESPSVRAKLLSVGREAGLLQSMIEKHRLTLKRDREQLKREEIEINELSCKLRVLAPLAGIGALVEIITGMQADAVAAKAAVELTRVLVARLEPLEARVRVLAHDEARLNAKITVPVIHDTAPLGRLIERLDTVGQLARLPVPPAPPVAPTVVDTAPLRRLIERLDAVGQVARLPALPPLPGTPTLVDTTALRALIISLRKNAAFVRLQGHLPVAPKAPVLQDCAALTRQITKLAEHDLTVKKFVAEAEAVAREQKAAADALHKYMHELGVCPTCDQPFKEDKLLSPACPQVSPAMA